MSAKRENGSEKGADERLRVCDAFAGGTPALPANRLTETPDVYDDEKAANEKERYEI